MKGISFDQFMKLKEFLRFEFELIRTKRSDAMEAAKDFDLALADLSLKTNAEHTLATVLTIARLIVASSQKTYNYLITKCIKFISANYSTNIGLYDAAKKLNISTVYLSQLFKKETGMNFNAYVNEYRLNRAKTLIDEGVYKINQISEMVGYNNTQYFSNCFKKKFK
ncbi:MAG: AraC family transcriptional regulator [Bacillus subtilis]|nr:AraC family transcriptional regulator [Bacillus subtilis]